MNSLGPGKKRTTIMTQTFLSCQNANVFFSLTLAFNKLKVLPMPGTKLQFYLQFLIFNVHTVTIHHKLLTLAGRCFPSSTGITLTLTLLFVYD